MPSPFTLVCQIVGVWTVIAQEAAEECLLAERFGIQYEAYRDLTPRWLIHRWLASGI